MSNTDKSLEKVSSETVVNGSHKAYYTRLNLPPKKATRIDTLTKVQENPYDARSPQEIMQAYGVYKDESIYSKNPEQIYADLTKFKDYQSMLNATISAKNQFNSLDVDIKAKFNNNPIEFANYLSSPDFDINNILTSDEQQKLAEYNAEKQAEADYQKYIKSDDFRLEQAEKQAYADYQKELYKEWKKNKK